MAADDAVNVSRLARLLELESDRWRPHRLADLLSHALGDRIQVGDASRYLFAHARRQGYDLPPYPLAGCGEIREFFADEGVRSVPEWYDRKLGVAGPAYEALPSQTILVARDRANRRKAFFLDGIRYRDAAAFESLADSGLARTFSEEDLDALLGLVLEFLAGELGDGSIAPDGPVALASRTF